MKLKTNEIIVPNGEYGWVIVFASFFVHVFVLGNIYSFGIFFPIYIDEFKTNAGTVSWIGSIGGGLMAGLAAYSGAWSDQYGNGIIVFIGSIFIGIGYLLASFSTEIWHLYLTQGFIAGIGYSLSFVGAVSVVSQWFTTRRGLAVGIAVAGSGLGQFAISLISHLFIASYGWRTALRYLALISFIGISLCSLLIKRLLPCYVHSKSESSLSFFKNRNFTIFFLAILFGSLGAFMPYTFLPAFAIKHGISKSKADFVLSITGILSAAGRVILGFISDKIGKIEALQICILFAGVSTICWIWCTTYTLLLVYASFYGFFAGGLISLIPGVCAEIMGIEKLGSSLGLIYSATSIGNFLSAPIGGFLFDAYQTYTPSIAVDGAFFLIGGVIFLFMKRNKIEKSEEFICIAQENNEKEFENECDVNEDGKSLVNNNVEQNIDINIIYNNNNIDNNGNVNNNGSIGNDNNSNYNNFNNNNVIVNETSVKNNFFEINTVKDLATK
jgi:MFS family permease